MCVKMLLTKLPRENTHESTALYTVREEPTDYTNHESQENRKTRLLKRIPLERLMDLKLIMPLNSCLEMRKTKTLPLCF